MSGFPLPDAVFDQHVILLGKTRSGKSSVARLCVEHLLDRDKPVCIVDPKGDWWGLKSSADGKHAGYPIVIFGGEHGDVPINPQSGRSIAELVATADRSCVIDLGGWMVGDRTQFWIDFASHFFRLHRGRHYLVVDEVHNLCPKGKILNPKAGEMLHWSNRLASEGLGKGISMIAASQRPQKVHNDFLTSCETLIAMRVIHPRDREAIMDWINDAADPELGKEILGSLASMKRGEGWAWSPESKFGPKRIEFPLFSTYDSFKAQASTAPARLKGWADVNLDEVKQKLASVVKEAEAKDPVKLQQRIRELEKQLRAAPAQTTAQSGADPRAIERAVRAAKSEYEKIVVTIHGDRKRLYAQGAKLADALRQLAESAAKTFATAGALQQLPKFRGAEIQQKGEARKPEMHPRTEKAAVHPPLETSNGHGLTPYQVDILRGLAELEAIGRTEASFALAGVAAEKSATSSTFERYRSRLLAAGLITYPKPGQVALTDAGRAIAPRPDQPLTSEEVQERCLRLLTPYQADLIRALLGSYPNAISRDELGELAGKQSTSSTFERYVSSLRTMEIVEYVGPGRVKVQDWLFV